MSDDNGESGLFLQFKGQFSSSKNKYLDSSTRCANIFFFFFTQNEMFIRMERLLFSIQQTLTVNKCKEREKFIQKIKNVQYHSKVFQLGMTFFVVERN